MVRRGALQSRRLQPLSQLWLDFAASHHALCGPDNYCASPGADRRMRQKETRCDDHRWRGLTSSCLIQQPTRAFGGAALPPPTLPARRRTSVGSNDWRIDCRPRHVGFFTLINFERGCPISC